MNIKWRVSSTAICLIASGLMAVPRSAVAETVSDSVLELSLSVDDGTFALYEPVIVTYTVRNPTDAPIEAMVFLDMGARSLDLSISQNGQPGQPFRAEVDICRTHYEPNRFAPGESKSRSVDLFYNQTTRGLAFPTPGLYKIEGRLTGVQARPIVIQVVEPNAWDREAIAFLGSEGDLVRLERYGAAEYCKEATSRSVCVQRLLTFVDKYETSSYAPAVAFQLVMEKASGSYPQGIARDLPKSGALLEMFFKSWGTHPFAPDVIALLAGDLAKSGQGVDAKPWVDRLRKNYPNRKDQLEELERQLGGRDEE